MELLLSVGLVVIISVSMVIVSRSFRRRQDLKIAANMLINDLRQTQQFARTMRDDYKFYGLMLCRFLGPDLDRQGYKIVAYDPPGIDVAFPPDRLDFKVIKGSDVNDNPEFLEDTFFEEYVTIAPASGIGELDVGDAIIFIPEGSATLNGTLEGLLPADLDSIVLVYDSYSETIKIIPFTGYIKLQ